MNSTRWIHSVVNTQPDLYRAMYDWNIYPHRWAAPAWLAQAQVAPEAIALLEQSHGGRRQLSRHFRSFFALNELFWEFQEPRRRLVLLSVQSLENLARFAGASLLAARLARVVTKEDRRLVTERVSARAYDFAMRHGRLRAGTTGLESLASGEASLGDAVEQTGWSVLAACFREEAPAFWQRFRLKTPPERISALPEENQVAQAQAWTFVEPIAREILNREELQCFA